MFTIGVGSHGDFQNHIGGLTSEQSCWIASYGNGEHVAAIGGGYGHSLRGTEIGSPIGVDFYLRQCQYTGTVGGHLHCPSGGHAPRRNSVDILAHVHSLWRAHDRAGKVRACRDFRWLWITRGIHRHHLHCDWRAHPAFTLLQFKFNGLCESNVAQN